MVKNISPKQRRIVKAKIKGVKNKDIGKQEYPNANSRLTGGVSITGTAKRATSHNI
jgi:hypothetical protein